VIARTHCSEHRSGQGDRCRERGGYTLMEVIVVMAILVLLAVIVLPSVFAFRGDTRPRAAADMIRAELASARARASEDGVPYRIAITQDGKRIRRAPDNEEFATATAVDHPSPGAKVVEYAFEYSSAKVVAETDAGAPAENDGYTTIATVLPGGSCREDNVIIAVTDDDGATLHIRVRGLTGSSRVVPNPNGGTR
jgi:prepilin-type N-terminal cleavage/methylation domain-containing protein